jgi:large subunit ribosomal protein L21
VTNATVTVAAVITKQVNDLVAHAHTDHASKTIVDAEAAHEITGAAPQVPKWLDNTDLLQIDGIGPKVSGHLKNAGVSTITQLAATPAERLQEILDAAGSRFGAIDPSTWPEQAQALVAGGQA